jgi:ATP-binding cassette subfamily B protein
MQTNASVGATLGRRSRYLRGLAVEAAPAKEIRVFGLAGWLVTGYADTYRKALDVIWRGRRLGMRTVLLATSGVVVAHAAVLGAIGAGAAGGTLSLAEISVFGQAVLASSALGYLFGVEVPLARSRQGARQALALERDLLGDDPAPAARPPRSLNAGPLPVTLNGVWFTYPGREAATLRGFDLSIPAGQSVAIVGLNGAGKSTLVKLICGLYQVESGLVEVGGTPPVRAQPQIAAIFQNFTRFELPLRANVGFGDLTIVDDENALDRALTEAGAGRLAGSLAAGWDTVLSSSYPGGQDLSGGQWQKVALARAWAAVRAGAGLLILDEPAASLDVRAETELFDRLLSSTLGATRIIVSHRLASVRQADRIVVIADGTVVEDGPHEALMAAGGRYAAMFARQAERFALTDTTTGGRQ